MKLATSLLFLSSCISAVGSPVSYQMSFVGGFFSDVQNKEIPYAPDSGNFTYDPAKGFSNFTISYYGNTFNLTALANAPQISSTPTTCITGTSAQEFTLLTTSNQWGANEVYAGAQGIETGFSLPGMTALEPAIPIFIYPGKPITGTYTISSVPEPATIGIAALCLLLTGLCRFRFRGLERATDSGRNR